MSGMTLAPTYGRKDLGGLLSSQPLIATAATAVPDRARAFYAYVLGLATIEDTPLALVFDAGGTMLRLQKVRAVVPTPHAVLSWHVGDIVVAVRGLLSRGVPCERLPGLVADNDGLYTDPSGTRFVWFRDPDGNLLSLMQFSQG